MTLGPNHDSSVGAGLRMHGCLHKGDAATKFWKCYTNTCQVVLKWDVNYLLSDLGHEDKGKMRSWRHIHDTWGRWSALLSALGLDVSVTMGRSRHALTQYSGEDKHAAMEVAEQDHWITTAGLLGLMT